MKKFIPRAAILLTAALAFLPPKTGWARNGLSGWFRELRGEAKVRVGVGTDYSPRRDVKGQEGGFGWTGYEAGFFLPFLQDGDEEWSLTGGVSLRDISSPVLLPDSNVYFPGELWDLDLGFLHRRRLPNRWTLGLNLSLSSPSDEPFAGWDETSLMLNGFLEIPDGARNAWVVFLNYSANREFLPHVPIPGGGYLFAPSRNFTALAGVPLVFLNYRPFSRLSLRASYFPIHSVSAEAELECQKNLTVFGEFRWVNERYFRSGREDRRDRLFWYEKKLQIGVKISPKRGFELVVAGAYAFDRFFFEGDGYEDRLDNRIDIADGFSFNTRVRASF
jgi:hypothetical protein